MIKQREIKDTTDIYYPTSILVWSVLNHIAEHRTLKGIHSLTIC